MGLPVVVCYTTDRALEVLNESGVTEIEIIKTKPEKTLEGYRQEERVICQREKSEKIELIVS